MDGPMQPARQITETLRSLAIEVQAIDLGFPSQPVSFGPPEPYDAISAIAGELGVVLPDDYRWFAANVGGISAPDVFNGYFIHSASLLRSVNEDPSFPTSVLHQGYEQKLVCIGGDGGGNLWLIGGSEPFPVFKWEHERGCCVEALSCVADGFTALLKRIAQDWQHFEQDDREWKYLAS
jgi:hypothetical protein